MLKRTVSRLLTFVFLAIAAGSVGCTDARPGGESLSSAAKPDPSSSETWLSTEELQVLGTHISPTISAEFTADGKWIVVAGTDGVTIHNALSTQCVRWFNGKLVEVSPDGVSFLLKHPSGPVELRSIPDGRLVWRLPRDVTTSELHFTDDGQYIVCGYCNLLRIETREVAYRSPDTYYFDTIDGGDRYGDPADRPPQVGEDNSQLAAKQSVLPYIYRTTLRHDARPLITPRSGLCSPAGRFMIVQTGEEDSSLEPYYSFINRKTGERLFSNARSCQALFFHNDDYVFYEGSVYRTSDREIPYQLGEGVTAFALNADETMLAAGWQDGQVAILDPISGKESCRLTVEKHIDTRGQKSGDIVSLAFSHDSRRLAAVGRNLTLIDIPARTISDSLHLGPGSRAVAKPETTSPAEIVFNADDSRLLLTGQQGDEYIYSRARVHVLHATDLGKRRALVSTDHFDRLGKTPPVYFNSDGAWAIVPEQLPHPQADRLRVWETDARQPVAEISPVMFQWHYRRRFVVPDFPKRHLGLGHFRSWYADELVFHPWSIDAIESSQETVLPDGAKQWLEIFVRVNPHNTSRYTNGRTLDLPSRQWVLSFNNNRIHRLYDLSTGEIYPPDAVQTTPQQAREVGAIDTPKTCWGLSTSGIAFSPEGSHLLVYRHSYKPGNELLALFEMPAGKLIRNYEGHSHIERIHIAPSSRIAAISTDFYRKTWIIDLGTGATLVELPQGGKCVFSPDSRYAQVGDRYGESQSLLEIETGKFIDFDWADRWSFSPNSRYAVGGSSRTWAFVDLATGEKTEISGEVHRTGMQTLSTTELAFPHQGSRFLCGDQGKSRLFDVNAAVCLAEFDAIAIAKDSTQGRGRIPNTYNPVSASGYLYAPNDQDFLYAICGSEVNEGFALDQHERVPERQAKEYSTQILTGDLETGQQIQCSAANWSRSPLQHRLFAPDGAHFITISSDKVVCWKLHPLEQAWETSLSDGWTDPETGTPFPRAETLGWSVDYAVHPSDQSILIAADGREAILFSLATGKEMQRFGPLPISSVLRFGADGTHLQVGFRANRSMKLYDASTGELINTYHFTNEGTELHRFGPSDTQDSSRRVE